MNQPNTVTITAYEARVLTDGIKVKVDDVLADLAVAWEQEAWKVLGYATWDVYCATEFAGCRFRLPVAERRDNVIELRSHGMSSRAIGAALGIHSTTALGDLAAGAEESAPAVVVGVDGKRYPARGKPVNDPERLAAIRGLAEEGHTSDQIAKHLGIRDEYVRKLARMADIEIPADKAVGRRRNIDFNRFVEQTVMQAEAVSADLDMVRLASLEVDKLNEWARSLRRSAKALNALARALDKEADAREDSNG